MGYIRDQHMLSILELMEYNHKATKAIVWEHNTLISNPRDSDMLAEGMITIGRLPREQFAAVDFR